MFSELDFSPFLPEVYKLAASLGANFRRKTGSAKQLASKLPYSPFLAV